jgi:hypothetical protein
MCTHSRRVESHSFRKVLKLRVNWSSLRWSFAGPRRSDERLREDVMEVDRKVWWSVNWAVGREGFHLRFLFWWIPDSIDVESVM